MNTKHGVLMSGHSAVGADLSVGTMEGSILFHSPVDTLLRGPIDLAELALAYGLTHLWVMADCGITPDREWWNSYDPGAWSLLDNWLYQNNIGLPPGEKNLLKAITGYRRGGGQKQVTICFVGQSGWSWARTPDLSPQSLLGVISQLERDLGVQVATSPSSVGTRLLKAKNEGHADWLKVPTGIQFIDLPWGDAAKNLIWSRQLTDEEYQNGKWVHKVDKNAMYLRACVEEMFGCGELVRCPAPWAVPDGVNPLKTPGIWCVTILGEHNPHLPPPIWDDSTWIATPLLKLLHQMGYQVGILDGYYFRESHGIFKNWAEQLWSVRESYKRIPPLKNAIKEIYTATLGLVKSDKVSPDSAIYRPDWNCQVVAGARAGMMYNMLRYAKQGITPVMVYIDALLYVSPYPAVAFSLPGILDHQNSLGGFKHEWTLPLNEGVRDVLASDLPRAKKLETLNAWAAFQEVAL